ncbi:fructosamine kinase family protein [Aquimarina brevivitae]|uniref:Protein kinase domain-containing protein n=1 Tax=Aquimarina brevivitae TaxID=323412 RepID=A0A4Q7NZ46_9FLAO|nr:fructosamine kinase family protein [Aquimarina brevivitae]RZS92268.1 hypothetical protein EV197_2904 [Aquimarina brevivitae]
MIDKVVLTHLEALFDQKVNSFQPLSGGDINEVFRLDIKDQRFVIKINNASRFPAMFEAETKGLQVLSNNSTFSIPEVLYEGVFEDQAYLVMPFIDSRSKAADFWEDFGLKLAALHKQTKPYFGLTHDNYIGSLPQYNSKEINAVNFYINQRIQPQIKLAQDSGFLFSGLASFYKNCSKIIPNEPSSLIHGDLWGGNYMVDQQGKPCLIDPAVAYAPREMDIAMMHLFGGFDPKVFHAYNEAFPLPSGWRDRLKLWQLYYLLVHLNIFGSSYFTSVREIIKNYQ